MLGILFLICQGKHPALSASGTNNIPVHQPQSSVPLLTLEQFKKVRNQTNVLVVDTRSGDEFLHGFIPKSINIGLKGPFETYLMQVIPNRNQQLLLVVDTMDKNDAVERLTKLGYNRIMGILDGGIMIWKAHEPLDSLKNITPRTFFKSDQGHIVDVRTEKEFAAGHIDNAMNIPLTDFANFGITLKKDDDQIYLHCQSGYRSAIAVSILSAKGFKNICNIQGGYKALSEEIKENR